MIGTKTASGCSASQLVIPNVCNTNKSHKNRAQPVRFPCASCTATANTTELFIFQSVNKHSSPNSEHFVRTRRVLSPSPTVARIRKIVAIVVCLFVCSFVRFSLAALTCSWHSLLAFSRTAPDRFGSLAACSYCYFTLLTPEDRSEPWKRSRKKDYGKHEYYCDDGIHQKAQPTVMVCLGSFSSCTHLLVVCRCRVFLFGAQERLWNNFL